jgi:hypothetical protein
MGTAGAAESATVGTLLPGHWYDAVLALLAELGRAHELAAVARRVLDQVPA